MSETPDQKVEDVLSSVRRLVSSELPRKPRAETPEGPGALVLTKAYMVPENGAAQSVDRSLEDRIAELEQTVGGQETEFEPDGSEDQSVHRPDRIVYKRPETDPESTGRPNSQRLSQISMINTEPATESDDAGHDCDVGTMATPEFRRETKLRSEAAAADKVTTNASPSELAEPTALKIAPLTLETPISEAPMAEDVPTVAAVTGEVAAFSDPDDVVRTFEARVEAGRPISDPSPLTPLTTLAELRAITETPSDVVAAPSEPSPKMEETDRTHAKDLDDFDAALDEAVAASIAGTNSLQSISDGDFAPDDLLDAGDFDLNPSDSKDDRPTSEILTPSDAEDLAPQEDETKVANEETSEPVSSGTDPKTTHDAPASDANVGEPTNQAIAALAALPEEEAMRLLIARMIRDELQGDLGERITRNVRKLVRREVKRALSSKDLT